MQLVILIMVNILIASIFYLVISLKLERSATEYRSKRLRKEMEELINEFNHTAERNLALLEYKINILRELLKRADALPSLDITINDNNEKIKGVKKGKKKISQKENIIFPAKIDVKEEEYTLLKEIPADILKRESNKLDENTIVYLQKEKNESLPNNKNQVPPVKEQLSEIVKILFDRIRLYIVNKYNKKTNDTYLAGPENISADLTEEYATLSTQNDEKTIETVAPRIDEEELMEIYQNADDKYLMIAKLYSQGYPLQLLSKISGIPIGEISLILNLSMKK